MEPRTSSELPSNEETIEIAIFNNPRAAQALVDYLATQHIAAELIFEECQSRLVITDPAQQAQAQKICDEFFENPNQDKYLSASWDTGTTENQLDYGSSSIGLIQQFWQHAGGITLSVFFTCLALFVAIQFYGDQLFFHLGFVGVHLDSSWSQIWRLFTPSLLHADFVHFIFNLFWWWYLAGNIETKHSRLSLLILLLLAGTLPNLLQYYWQGPFFLGLSGVVYALASYTWLYGSKVPNSPIGLPNAYMGMMLIWLILGFTGFMNMANGAHLGGLIIGILIALWDIQALKSIPPKAR